MVENKCESFYRNIRNFISESIMVIDDSEPTFRQMELSLLRGWNDLGGCFIYYSSEAIILDVLYWCEAVGR